MPPSFKKKQEPYNSDVRTRHAPKQRTQKLRRVRVGDVALTEKVPLDKNNRNQNQAVHQMTWSCQGFPQNAGPRASKSRFLEKLSLSLPAEDGQAEPIRFLRMVKPSMPRSSQCALEIGADLTAMSGSGEFLSVVGLYKYTHHHTLWWY